MTEAVKRRYGNSRRQAQTRATRLKVIEAAKLLFTKHDYPATTIEAIAEAADTPLPTLYRLFGSKRAMLAAVLDTFFGVLVHGSTSTARLHSAYLDDKVPRIAATGRAASAASDRDAPSQKPGSDRRQSGMGTGGLATRGDISPARRRVRAGAPAWA